MNLATEMDHFAVVIYALRPKQDVARKYPLLARMVPASLIHLISRFWLSLYLSHVTGVRSEATGKEIEGWLLACPFTVRRMVQMSPHTAYEKIVQTSRMAQSLGARILWLLAFASVIGDGGVTIARRPGIPVTAGRSLTLAVAVEAVEEAARDRGIWYESYSLGKQVRVEQVREIAQLARKHGFTLAAIG